MYIPNLILIAGTGTKSGKTTMACRIIEQFKHLGITAIKISPHFHETTSGLNPVFEERICIYEETNNDTTKDTSRMLHAGAEKVYFAKVFDDRINFVFNKIIDLIPGGTPVICESPALRNFVEPGVFIIMRSETTNKHKNINHLLELPHVMFKFEELNELSTIPVEFKDGRWRIASTCRDPVATDPYRDFSFIYIRNIFSQFGFYSFKIVFHAGNCLDKLFFRKNRIGQFTADIINKFPDLFNLINMNLIRFINRIKRIEDQFTIFCQIVFNHLEDNSVVEGKHNIGFPADYLPSSPADTLLLPMNHRVSEAWNRLSAEKSCISFYLKEMAE